MVMDIPFYSSRGERCMQTCMRIVLKYFLDKDYSLDMLDKLTWRSGNEWTLPQQVAVVLADLGLEVGYYSSAVCGNGDIINQAHVHGLLATKRINDRAALYFTSEMLERNIFHHQTLSIAQIESLLDAGWLPIFVFDTSKFTNAKVFSGHAGVLTGYDADYWYYHESGPKMIKPHLKVSKMKLYDAMVNTDVIAVRSMAVTAPQSF